MREIAKLVDKYIDGATTGAEERALKEWMESHANDIPEEWQWLAALFEYEKQDQKSNKRQGRTINIRTIIMASCAASVALLIAISAIVSANRRTENFAVINGDRTTDREAVISEAIAALDMLSLADEETTVNATEREGNEQRD